MKDLKPILNEIKLDDLESLLRDSGNNLIVIKYSTEPLLPPGENYGSTILKVDAVVKKSPDDEEEELHLVAKMLPATDFQRDFFDSLYTFKKEIFLYKELLPIYRNLEREFGFKDDELFDIAPKLFGARCSLDSSKAEVDEDAVILMQNLKSLGYYCKDKRKGYDLVHSKVAVAALARFHGLGIALKQHKPDIFENIKHRAKNLAFAKKFDFSVPTNFFLKAFRESPAMSQYYDYLEKALNQDPIVRFSGAGEPWSTIVHSDFWVNNIMFKDQKEIKFVDFQNFLFMSGLRELIFCVMVNLDDEVMKNDFDYLLDYYYEKLVEVLKSLRCDTSKFSKDAFDERLRIDSFLEFQHIPFLLKVMTTENEGNDLSDCVKNVFMENQSNSVLLNKLTRVVLKYAEKGWIK